MLNDDGVKFGLLIVLVLVAGVGMDVIGADPDVGPGEDVAPEYQTQSIDEDTEREIHELINDVRAERGLEELEYHAGLASVARTHSRDMVEREYYAHQNPEGDYADGRVEEAGLRCSKTSENIHTILSDDVASTAVNDWMDSPGHRENIVRGMWEYEGIGIWKTEDGVVYVTQVFCQT